MSIHRCRNWGGGGGGGSLLGHYYKFIPVPPQSDKIVAGCLKESRSYSSSHLKLKLADE